MRYLASLLVACTPALGQGIPEAVEPNNSPGTATHVPLREQAEGQIQSNTDEDWYHLQLVDWQDVRLWTGPGLVNPVIDTRLRLLDGTGATLVTVDNAGGPHAGYSQLALGNLPPGDYYAVVTGRLNRTGSYTLDAAVADVGAYVTNVPLRPVFEGPENNDPRTGLGSASVSGLFTRNQGTLSAGGGGISWRLGPEDYDFYSFRLTTGGVVTLQTVPGASGMPATDTVIHLLDSTGTPIAFDDNSGPGHHARLLCNLPAATTFFAVVRGFDTVDTGSYVLEIHGPPPAAPGIHTASVTVRVSSCEQGGSRLHTRPAVPGGNETGPEVPVIGSHFCLDLDGLAPGAEAVIAMLEISRNLNPPILLSSLNYQSPDRCAIELVVDNPPADGFVTWHTLAPNATSFQWWIRIPPDYLTFRGLDLQVQAVIKEPGDWFTASNSCALRLGY